MSSTGPARAWRSAAAAAGRLRAESSESRELRRHVLDALALERRETSPRFLYDEAGAALFERICELDAYYLTRTEVAIHSDNAAAIAAAIGPRAQIIEFGSGAATKTRSLLASLDSPVSYVPVDVCRPQLDLVAADIGRTYPDLDVVPVCGDFASGVALPEPGRRALRRVGLYHGSTIGNLHPVDATSFLARVAVQCGQNGALLVGVDLDKDPALIERAYDDPEGVTAAFNLNLLRRINRECGASFDVRSFRHYAPYDSALSRIEMRLVSTADQVVSVSAAAESPDEVHRFQFRQGEAITTEYSYKYNLASFRAVATRAGWRVAHVWQDQRRWFSVWLLERGAGSR